MNQINLEKCKITELSKSEIVEIEGGKPTSETSFDYDLVWCLPTAFLDLGKGTFCKRIITPFK